jgi:hypothetical protein
MVLDPEDPFGIPYGIGLHHRLPEEDRSSMSTGMSEKPRVERTLLRR